MRPFVLGVVSTVALLMPNVGKAQALLLPTPPPQVTAQRALWQLNGEAVFFEGDYYFPTGPTVYFDGRVMVRSGVYRGVQLYTDATLQPYSMVFVPIGGTVMRPYERRRAGELAGTVGSRMPSFPIQRDVEVSTSTLGSGIQTPPIGPGEPPVVPEENGVRGTTGAAALPVVRPAAPIERTRARTIETIPPPQSNRGAWIQFNGARWYHAGASVPFSADRFTPIGEYHGFPVYRDTGGKSDDIYIPSVPGGLLAPYRK